MSEVMHHRGELQLAEKIAALPEAIRNEVCRRLHAGAHLLHVTNWLNGLPDVWQILDDKFGGATIHTINVRCWKDTGFRDWLEARRPVVVVAARPEPAKQTKIQRLSNQLRAKLCQRIHAGESANSIHAWLNALAEVRAMVAQYFRGLNISHADLKQWRETGYVDWAKASGLYCHHLGRKVITGKIAQFPKSIRDELCQRMHKGEYTTGILEWINALPEVQQIAQNRFHGFPVSFENISVWRGTGFKTWLAINHFEFPTRSNPTQLAKIKHLPPHILQELCQRMKAGQTGAEISVWVNELPEVKAILKKQFGGFPINDCNLSGWRNTGFIDWMIAQPKTETK